MAIHISDENYSNEILNSTKPVILDVYADWCSPCKMIAPIFEELSNELSSKYKFAKLNVDDAREISMELGVTSIPTFVFFKNGQIVDKAVGYKNKEELSKLIEKNLS